MAISERDWAREPLPAERDQNQIRENPVEGFDEWELTMTGEGFRAKRADPPARLGWGDVLFWVVLLVLARYFG